MSIKKSEFRLMFYNPENDLGLFSQHYLEKTIPLEVIEGLKIYKNRVDFISGKKQRSGIYSLRRKVEYLGHQISLACLEDNPKDEESLVNIPFPQTLRSMQSFLGSLNYYILFMEDFAICASALYELREADYYDISRVNGDTKNMSAVGPDEIREGCEENDRDLCPKPEIDVDR